MRDIRFRGLNHEAGEWVYGWYTKLVEGIRRFDAIISEIDGEFTRFYIHHPETIGQFTGLRDSKGQDIYEGDICRFESNIERAILFKDGAFGYETCGDFISFGGHYYLTQILRFVEVIGNIHEKPLDNGVPVA